MKIIFEILLDLIVISHLASIIDYFSWIYFRPGLSSKRCCSGKNNRKEFCFIQVRLSRIIVNI